MRARQNAPNVTGYAVKARVEMGLKILLNLLSREIRTLHGSLVGPTKDGARPQNRHRVLETVVRVYQRAPPVGMDVLRKVFTHI